MEGHLNLTSLSKGCFVHKPAKHKRKKSFKTTFKYNNSFLWDKVDAKIKQIEIISHTKTFDGLTSFLNSCFIDTVNESCSVPAAVLIMGVNMSDHLNIVHLLEKHLHSVGITGTIVLEPKKCINFSSMLQTIVSEYISKNDQFLNIEEYCPKKQECSFKKVYDLHQTVLEKRKFAGKSPRKRTLYPQAIPSSTNKIVFLIQDVENFSPELLQELILNCKIYAGKLPIILIFGMASAMVTLHSILPQKALCCLEVETFHSVVATEYLTKIIEEVIISPDEPFKLGPKVFKLLIDTVLYHDFSVSNLIYMLKFCMIEHLFNLKVSNLCCSESQICEKTTNLSDDDIQSLKRIPSLKEYMDNNPNFVSSADNSSTFKESINILIKKLFHSQKITLVLLKLLHCLVKDLPGYPLGKQLRELYSLSLEKEICSTPAFDEALKLLRMQSQNNLLIKLKKGLKVLEKENAVESSFTLEETKNLLSNYIDKLSNISLDDFEKKSHDSLFLQNEKIISRQQLQEKIQSSIKMKRSNFDALRNEILDDLVKRVFRNIQSPSHSPLHEIFYFDDVSLVKKSLMAVPRVTSCRALCNPSYYLKCNCCKIEAAEDIQPSMPDISILYKLHLESGKLINLCDWLQAFQSLKDVPRKGSPRKKTQVKDDNELNIRFLQTVSELQFLGFIKPTKRKTDHVARLTFGSF